jgi:membrane protein required for colicin V production
MTTVIDIVSLIIIAVCMIDGYRQGLVKSLLGLVLGIVSAILAYLLTRNLWTKLFDVEAPMLADRGELITALVGFIVVFVLLIIVSRILLKAAEFLNKVPVIGLLNRLLGTAFGFFGGVVIMTILAILYDIYEAYSGKVLSGELTTADKSVVLQTLYGLLS